MVKEWAGIEKDKKPPSWRLVDRPHLKIQFQLEPRDLWLGLFWRKTKLALHLYICLLPMVPLHITKRRVCVCWLSFNTGPDGECENCGGVPIARES